MQTITDYTMILPTGQENAISSEELALKMGFESTRALRLDIAKARENGQIILSCTQGGYYLPKDDEEIERFINTMYSRAIGIFKAIKYARNYLKQDKEQMNIEDILEDEF